MSVDIGSAVGYLDLDISGFLKGLRTAQEESSKTQKSISEKSSAKLLSVGKNMTSAGKTLAKSVTAPIVGLGAGIIKTGADFESAMSKVQAVSGATGNEMKTLETTARNFAKQSKFSATETAEAYLYMGMAGWDAGEMVDGLAGIMNLAAADGLDLATTSDIVTDALTAFGLKASDSGHFADVLAQTSRSCNTNVSMLGESFKYAAPVAGALGYKVEDVSLALGLMANSGIKSTQAGTSLKNLLTNMANPTDTMKAAMDALGVSLTDSNGNMKSLRQVMDDLRGGFGQLKIPQKDFEKQMMSLNAQLDTGKISQDEYNNAVAELTERAYGAEGAEKAKYAAMLAGKEGMAGLLTIINATSNDYNDLANAIDNSKDAAKEMAEIQLNNLKGKLTYLKSEVEEVALQFFSVLSPSINKVVDNIRAFVSWLSNLDEKHKELIAKLAIVAASIAPVLLAFGKLSTGIGKGIEKFTEFKAVVENLSVFSNMRSAAAMVTDGLGEAASKTSWLGAKFGEMGLTVGAGVAGIVAVIGVLVAAFLTLWNTNEDFRNKMISIWNQIHDTISSFVENVKNKFSSLGISFSDIVNVLKTIWLGFCDLLAPIFEAAFGMVSTVLSIALGVITGLLDVFIGLFTGNWSQCWNDIKTILSSAWDGIVSVLSIRLNVIKDIFSVVCGWFGVTWSDAWTKIKDFYSGIWDSISSKTSEITTNIHNKIAEKWENVKNSTSEKWNSIKDKISEKWDNIRAKTSSTAEAISTNVNNKFSNIYNTTSSRWDGIKTAIYDKFTQAKTNVSNIANSMSNSVSRAFDYIRSRASSTWNGIKEAIRQPIERARDLVSNAIDRIKSKFNFRWSLPHLALPHFSVSGRFSLRPPSVPHFSVSWYKKAMGGMIMNTPTIFGFDPTTGKFLGGGEAGSEAVVGTTNLMRMIRTAVAESVSNLLQGWDDNLANVYAILNVVNTNIATLLEQLKALTINTTADLLDALKTLKFTIEYPDNYYKDTAEDKIEKLRKMLEEILKDNPPPTPQVDVHMGDGNIYLDNERVGRQLAPTISRIIATAR